MSASETPSENTNLIEYSISFAETGCDPPGPRLRPSADQQPTRKPAPRSALASGGRVAVAGQHCKTPGASWSRFRQPKAAWARLAITASLQRCLRKLWRWMHSHPKDVRRARPRALSSALQAQALSSPGVHHSSSTPFRSATLADRVVSKPFRQPLPTTPGPRSCGTIASLRPFRIPPGQRCFRPSLREPSPTSSRPYLQAITTDAAGPSPRHRRRRDNRRNESFEITDDVMAVGRNALPSSRLEKIPRQAPTRRQRRADHTGTLRSAAGHRRQSIGTAGSP